MAAPQPSPQRRRWARLATARRIDLLVAAGLLVWGLPDVPWWWERPGHAGTAGQIAAALALTLAMSVPFAWRRRVPFLVLGLAAGVLAVRGLLHHDLISAFAAVLFAAYGLGSYSRAARRYARWLGWAALAAAVAVVVTSQGNRLTGAPLALLGAAFVLGDAASARRAESAAAVEGAHQAERTRIARELHDLVAHQLSAITVQAGAARMAASGRPDPVIATMEQLSRAALAELNQLLGALRQEPDGSVPRSPAPALADLDSLLAASRETGIAASLAVTGGPRPLPPGVELSGYRIIQEALANVHRHAPGAATRVTLSYEADQLRLDVVNASPPAGRHPGGPLPPPPGGRGVRGMRERAELYGGRLTAGPRPGGGFVVTAAIPYHADAAALPAGQATQGQAAAGQAAAGQATAGRPG
jgi:signal transduction histidine kinase